MRYILLKKEYLQNLYAIAPIGVIILILSLTLVPISSYQIFVFVISLVVLVVGMGLFKRGAARATLPMGEKIGSYLSKSRKLTMFILVGLIVGLIITFAEPDLMVLAMQVVSINKWLLILTVAMGVSIFLMFGIMRIIFQISITKILFFAYSIVIVLSLFVPEGILSVAFDSGAVTSGAISVPFILALGAGISAVRSSKTAKEDSFGLIALISVGPIIFVMLLGLFMEPNLVSTHTIATVSTSQPLINIFPEFLNAILNSAFDVFLILTLLATMFFVFNAQLLKLPKSQLIKIGIGLLYTFVGLTLFISAVSVGFLPIASIIGFSLTSNYFYLLLPIGLIIGLTIIFVEPAIHILIKTVEDITNKLIKKRTMFITLSIGFSLALFVSLVRVLYDIPILYIILPLYVIMLILLFFSPKLFSSIAFDSGGVSVGSMSTGFLLPFVMGACVALGNDILVSAFGTIGILATIPIVSIQVLGLFYKRAVNKTKKQQNQIKKQVVIYEFEV